MTHTLYRSLSRILFGVGFALAAAISLMGAASSLFLLIPLFCLATAALLYAELRRIRLIRQKICVHCGYDLRASKERCPECGEPFEQKRRSWFESP